MGIFSSELLCESCETVGKPKKHTKGYLILEIFLWICFLIPGVMYSLWRLTSKANICRACKSTHLIPLDSPKAKRILGNKAS